MNGVLVPVIWPDINVLRVCVVFLIGIRSCVDNLGFHIISGSLLGAYPRKDVVAQM